MQLACIYSYRVFEACQAEVIIILATLSAGTTSAGTSFPTYITCIAPSPMPKHKPGTLFKVVAHPRIGSLCVKMTVERKKTWRQIEVHN